VIAGTRARRPAPARPPTLALLAGALAAAACLALAPRDAGAHATVISSNPQPGDRLRTAPGVVVLTFSQPLNVRLSRAEVDAPDGARFSQGSVSQSEIRVPLASNAPGVYEVRWTSVSAGDGHVLGGSFRFGVGVSPGASADESAPAAGDLALAAPRGLEYAGLLLAVGLLLLGLLAGRSPPLAWVRSAGVPAALAVAAASGLAVVLGETAAAAGGLSADGVLAFLSTGASGWARAARVGLEAAALAVALRRPRLAAAPLAGALVALAAAGHAAAARPAAGAVAATSLHLAAAGVWAGGIAALALQRPPGGWLGAEGRRLLARFTPVALAAFGVTAATGALEAASELAAVRDLAATAYGQVLALKVLAVLLMLPLSALAWRRLRPAPRVEALLALVAVGASALLAAFPLPPARLQEAQAVRAGPSAGLALPRDGDLTLASSAGQTLVALTLRPGLPGRNTAWLFVLPLTGEQGASGLSVSMDGAPLRRCGPACRAGDLALRGGETVTVAVRGEGGGGGTASFAIPALPAPDARGAVDAAQREMHALTTYRVEETLRPSREPVTVRYDYQAPDRMRFRVEGGSETVMIGPTRWSRDGPAGPWKVDVVPPLPVPSFVWDDAPVVGPRALGAVVEDGRELRGVSFFETDGEVPIWFELWIDAGGRVRRAGMRAQGHFMEHRYTDLDAPFTVEPPG
jgi:copper transport protein